MNKCIFMGRLTRDPELKVLSTGVKVVNFGLVTNRKHKNKSTGQEVDDKVFLEMEAWDTGASLISEYFKKGDPILVDCSAKLDQWEDSEGNKRSKLKFRVNSFEFLNKNRSESQSE